MKFDKISILFVPQFHFLQFSFKECDEGGGGGVGTFSSSTQYDPSGKVLFVHT